MNLLPKLRIIVPSACQFRCLICHNEHNQDSFDYNREALRYAMRKISSTSLVKHVNISGGEPLHPNNIDITKEIAGDVQEIFPMSSLSLNTNAMNITREITEWLSTTVNYVKVSLYGMTESAYLSYTGISAFGHVKTGIDVLIESGISVKINVLSTKHTAQLTQMKYLLNFCSGRLLPIKFIEVITHDWFNDYKLTACENLFVSPQTVERRLILLGAKAKYSLFDRRIMIYKNIPLEIYRYPNSLKDTDSYSQFGWGSFLRADGITCSIELETNRQKPPLKPRSDDVSRWAETDLCWKQFERTNLTIGG